jgi:hypothetical protein
MLHPPTNLSMGPKDLSSRLGRTLDGRSQLDPLSFGIMFPTSIRAWLTLKFKITKGEKTIDCPTKNST